MKVPRVEYSITPLVGKAGAPHGMIDTDKLVTTSDAPADLESDSDSAQRQGSIHDQTPVGALNRLFCFGLQFS